MYLQVVGFALGLWTREEREKSGSIFFPISILVLQTTITSVFLQVVLQTTSAFFAGLSFCELQPYRFFNRSFGKPQALFPQLVFLRTTITSLLLQGRSANHISFRSDKSLPAVLRQSVRTRMNLRTPFTLTVTKGASREPQMIQVRAPEYIVHVVVAISSSFQCHY